VDEARKAVGGGWGSLDLLREVLVSLFTSAVSTYVMYLMVHSAEEKARQQSIALVNQPVQPTAPDSERERARLFLRKVSRKMFLSLTPRQQRALLRAAPGELLKRFPNDEELQSIVHAVWAGEEVACTENLRRPLLRGRARYFGPLAATGGASGLVIFLTLRYWPSFVASAWVLAGLITWVGGRVAVRTNMRTFGFPRSGV